MFIKNFSVQSLQVESMRQMVRDTMSVENFRTIITSLRPDEEEEMYIESLTKGIENLSKDTKERLDALSVLGLGEDSLAIWRKIFELSAMRDMELARTNVLMDILTLKNNELAFLENMIARAEGGVYGDSIRFWEETEDHWNLFGMEGDDLDMQ